MKRILRCVIALTLCFACILQLGGTAFAATISGKKYVSDVILSYGMTDDEAKKWLTDNGYKFVDANLNAGADDTFSHKRSVYLGYMETNDAKNAITDMRLMNMNGGYSVSDYQVMLEEMKTNIRSFIDNFVIAVTEYRTNYEAGKPRAVAVHDMLNLLFEDDTESLVGDLLLEKIKEEYTDEEFAAMSIEEQSAHADMTAILMQGNKSIVLAIEQIIAMAADDSDTLWIERYETADSYDTMYDKLLTNGVKPKDAVKQLAGKYDRFAAILASKVEAYRDYINAYLEIGVDMHSTKAELDEWAKDKTEREISAFLTAGTQYEFLENTVYDKDLPEGEDNTLLDLFTNEDYDLEGEDRYLLYPLVSVLSEGQLACLEFLPLFQLVMLGMNDEKTFKETVDSFEVFKSDKGCVSVYCGVDRGIYGDNVALTNEALRLQNSSDADYSERWWGEEGISLPTTVMYLLTSVSFVATVTMFTKTLVTYWDNEFESKAFAEANEFVSIESEGFEVIERGVEESFERSDSVSSISSDFSDVGIAYNYGTNTYWQKVFFGVSVAFAVVTVALSIYTVWRTYNELKEYYNVNLTPIPKYMVDETQNEYGEKVFTYYDVTLCNRQQAGFLEERTENLKSFGDINGDVGLQWVALYTTKDAAAGNPITTDFVTQTVSSDIPTGKKALSMFGEKTAQNLTNKKSGYTFEDQKGGVYLFYGEDASALTATAVSGGVYALIGAAAFLLVGIVSYVTVRRKENARKVTHNA